MLKVTIAQNFRVNCNFFTERRLFLFAFITILITLEKFNGLGISLVPFFHKVQNSAIILRIETSNKQLPANRHSTLYTIPSRQVGPSGGSKVIQSSVSEDSSSDGRPGRLGASEKSDTAKRVIYFHNDMFTCVRQRKLLASTYETALALIGAVLVLCVAGILSQIVD